MRNLLLTGLFCLIVTPVCAAETAKTEDQKTLYALGQLVGRQLSTFDLTPSEIEAVKEGFADVISGKPSGIDIEIYAPKAKQFAQTRIKTQAEKQVKTGKEFLEKAAKEKGAVKTESGLIYLSLKEGAGAAPSATDKVKVNYLGTLTDGKVFDSSYKNKEPIDFKLDNVIKCWSEGIRMMKVGGKAKLVCPSTLAYGDAGAGSGLIPPGATLVFEVELLDILK